MTVKLYQYTKEKKRLDKTNFLTNEYIPAEGVKMTANQDLHYPVFLLTSPTKPHFNYCYIEEFELWYYLSEPRWVANDVWEYQCKLDVLYSHLNYIKNLNVVLSRNQSLGWTMLKDDRIVANIPYQNCYTYRPLSEKGTGPHFDVQTSTAGNNYRNIIVTDYVSDAVNNYVQRLNINVSITPNWTYTNLGVYTGTTSNSSVHILVRAFQNVLNDADASLGGVTYSSVIYQYGNYTDYEIDVPLSQGSNMIAVSAYASDGNIVTYQFDITRT